MGKQNESAVTVSNIQRDTVYKLGMEKSPVLQPLSKVLNDWLKQVLYPIR